MFMGVSNDPRNAGQLCEFIRGTLRVTAGHEDFATWIGAVDASNHLADFGIRGGCDCTGVEHRNIARIKPCFCESIPHQLPFDGGSIRMARPAPEIDKVERAHDGFMLCEIDGISPG